MGTESIVISVSDKGTLIVKRNIESIGKSAKKATTSVQFLKRALTGFIALQALKAVVNTLRSFDQALSTVQAISGATSRELAKLRDVAKDLGATTRFSATQAAEGLLFLSRAGFTVSEQLLTIEGTLQLAQAGALDLGRAADIASNVLRGFNLNASETGRVVDVLALAANRSNTTVGQLGDALKFVAPVAQGVGLSLEDTVAAISELSNAGLQATLAGTGLRRVISGLEAPSKRTQKIIDSLATGLDKGAISGANLFASLQQLSDAGVDVGQALKIFGQRGGPAFQVLATGSESAAALAEQLRNAGGTAAEVSRIMDKNLNGALLAVRSAAEAVVLAFGDLGNTNVLTLALRGLAGIFRFLARNIEIVEGAIIGLAIVSIPFLIAQLTSLAAAIIATGFGGILVTIGAVTGALVAFGKEVRIAEESTATLGDVAGEAFSSISSGVSSTVVDIANKLFPAVDGAKEKFSSFGQVVLSSFRFVLQAFDVLIGAAGGAVAAIIAAFKSFPQLLADIFIRAFNFVVQLVEKQIGKIVDLLNKLPGIDIDFSNEFLKLENPFKEAGDTVGAAFSRGFNERMENGAASLLDDIVAASLAGAAADDAAKKLADALAAGPTLLPSGDAGAGAPPAAAVGALVSSGVLADLEQQEMLLRLTNAQRTVEQDLLTITAALRKDNIQLTSEEEDQLRVRLGQVQALSQVSQALDQVRGAEINLKDAQIELNNQIADGIISTTEATAAYRLLENQVLETSTTMEAGFQRGFNRITEQAADFASVTENLLVSTFDKGSDALAEFAVSGFQNTESLKESFNSLVDDILKQLAKLLINQAFLALLGGGAGGALGGLAGAGGAAGGLGALGGLGGLAGGGGGGGGAGAAVGGLLGKTTGSSTGLFGGPAADLFAGFFAGGGGIPSGQFGVVGEDGPEFVSGPAQIQPMGAPQSPPEVNIQIVNVQSQDEAADAINTPRGTQNILNTLGQNRDQVNQLLGR